MNNVFRPHSSLGDMSPNEYIELNENSPAGSLVMTSTYLILGGGHGLALSLANIHQTENPREFSEVGENKQLLIALLSLVIYSILKFYFMVSVFVFSLNISVIKLT